MGPEQDAKRGIWPTASRMGAVAQNVAPRAGAERKCVCQVSAVRSADVLSEWGKCKSRHNTTIVPLNSGSR